MTPGLLALSLLLAAGPGDATPPAASRRAAPAPAETPPPDEEVIEDPEDDPRPRPRRAGARASRVAARPAGRPTAKPPFVPRILVGGYVSMRSSFDLGWEGWQRGRSADLRTSEDVFELLTKARLHVTARWKRWSKLRLGARFQQWLSAERPAPGKAHLQAWSSRAEVELEEAYVDLYLGPVDLRIGNQIVAWGLNDLVNPNDVINPLDLRRGFLSFDGDTRRPVLAVKADFHWRWFKAELLWVPFFGPHRLDVWGSDFAMFGPGASSALAEAEQRLERLVDPSIRHHLQPVLVQTKRPPDDLTASTGAVRLSASHKKWDLALQYVYGWDRTPSLSVDGGLYALASRGGLFIDEQLSWNTLGVLMSGRPLFRATYEHRHQLGLSVGKAFESVALKLDVSYEPDRGFVRTDIVPDPIAGGLQSLRIEHHTLTSALSLEVAHGQLFLMQVELVHLALLDRKAGDSRELLGFLSEPHVALALIMLRFQFLRETLKLIIGGAVDLLHGSFALAPTLTYQITDHWRVGLGALIFQGSNDTLFGGWTQNDLVYADLRFSF